MQIRKAVKLAFEGNRLRRPNWPGGVYFVNENLDVVFYNERGELEMDCYLDINDLAAEDYEVVK